VKHTLHSHSPARGGMASNGKRKTGRGRPLRGRLRGFTGAGAALARLPDSQGSSLPQPSMWIVPRYSRWLRTRHGYLGSAWHR
jgi:hypothetical protein